MVGAVRNGNRDARVLVLTPSNALSTCFIFGSNFGVIGKMTGTLDVASVVGKEEVFYGPLRVFVFLHTSI